MDKSGRAKTVRKLKMANNTTFSKRGSYKYLHISNATVAVRDNARAVSKPSSDSTIR